MDPKYSHLCCLRVRCFTAYWLLIYTVYLYSLIGVHYLSVYLKKISFFFQANGLHICGHINTILRCHVALRKLAEGSWTIKLRCITDLRLCKSLMRWISQLLGKSGPVVTRPTEPCLTLLENLLRKSTFTEHGLHSQLMARGTWDHSSGISTCTIRRLPVSPGAC